MSHRIFHRRIKSPSWVDDLVCLDFCPRTGKRKHSRRGARAVMKRLRAEGDSQIHVYRCPYCGSCHVGHSHRSLLTQHQRRNDAQPLPAAHAE